MNARLDVFSVSIQVVVVMLLTSRLIHTEHPVLLDRNILVLLYWHM